MNCTRCNGTGLLNSELLPGDIASLDVEQILAWVRCHQEWSDVTVCNCCGDGESAWHGEPGIHYTAQDPMGRNGPYAYNGGLCECH